MCMSLYWKNKIQFRLRSRSIQFLLWNIISLLWKCTRTETKQTERFGRQKRSRRKIYYVLNSSHILIYVIIALNKTKKENKSFYRKGRIIKSHLLFFTLKHNHLDSYLHQYLSLFVYQFFVVNDHSVVLYLRLLYDCHEFSYVSWYCY